MTYFVVESIDRSPLTHKLIVLGLYGDLSDAMKAKIHLKLLNPDLRFIVLAELA